MTADIENDIKDPILVSVRVNAALWEYLTGINGGSDIIFPDYRGELWIFVRSRLKPTPKDYKPNLPGVRPGIVRIVIPFQSGTTTKVFNVNTERLMEENLLYRNYLDEAGQRQVEDFLMRGFKKQFRAFMMGAVSCNTDQEIKSAIYKFCETHGITMEAISYEMLKKDWYRHRTKMANISPENGSEKLKM